MSFYITYNNDNENCRNGSLTKALDAAARKADVSVMATIEEHGWVDASEGVSEKTAYKMALPLDEEDKAALQSLGAEISNVPPKGYGFCTVSPR